MDIASPAAAIRLPLQSHLHDEVYLRKVYYQISGSVPDGLAMSGFICTDSQSSNH